MAVNFHDLGGTSADKPYWNALAEGRLEMQRCAKCATWHWPAVWRCADCGSWEQEWVAVPMEGEIYTWTRTWHPFPGTEGFGSPFVTVSVTLPTAGNKRLSGILTPDGDVKIGAKVVGTPAANAFGGSMIPSIHWRLA